MGILKIGCQKIKVAFGQDCSRKPLFHSSLFILHSSFFTFHSSLFILHFSLFTLHFSFFTLLPSPSCFKESLASRKEEDDAARILYRYHPEGGIVVEVLGYYSAQQATDAES